MKIDELLQQLHQASEDLIAAQEKYQDPFLDAPLTDALLNFQDAITPGNILTLVKALHDARAPVDEMAAFEAVFPMPAHTTRLSGGYAATDYNAWDAHTFCKNWNGWKARAALYQQQINKDDEND
ncbi:TPA: hypothetical protein H2W59_004286 [Salmonella enterica]|nr:hypothetical protein [Salmonella enterica]HAK8439470.1 hypothetical protein [Salmonella enterica]